MSQIDLTYYRSRLTTERARADACEQVEVRRIHAELAERYAILVGERPAMVEVNVPVSRAAIR
ncbi:hypothetical protein ASE86_13915 [Sphingomonas sp. Leaf33]|uniref:hypothetical protein n=1 Tax=Sphingomonas sp. Leaf33 TaxID=1736215 RepID=UPI0006FF0966|nr:hypothetical protein [Sphingomonas sp. Leaf33]KQN19549.1 hypothetical protein ASE86_13915 [Sphingomonas sp. Leaf33]